MHGEIHAGMPAARTVGDLRRGNRSVLLSRLYVGEPCSRQELSHETGLSQATVSNVIAELVAEGLVVEAGTVGSDGGRPRTLLRVDPGFARVIGVDVGETRVRVDLVDLAMRPLAAVDRPLPPAPPDPELVVAQVVAGVGEVLAAADVDPADVLGVGVGVFGAVERDGEDTVHAPTVGWDAVPLGRMLRAGTQVPVLLDNGARALGQAEMLFGAGRGARDAVVLLLGSGVGAAIVTGGALYRGASRSAGEWGHTNLVPGGRRCRCGALGCLEAYVGAGAVVQGWRPQGGGRPAGEDEESAFAALLAEAASSPGGAASRVVHEAVDHLGTGIADLVNLLNPERVVVAGWAGHALGEHWLPAVRAAVARQALGWSFAQTSLVLGGLGPEAVALGAATLPVADLLARGGHRRGSAAAPRRTSATA